MVWVGLPTALSGDTAPDWKNILEIQEQVDLHKLLPPLRDWICALRGGYVLYDARM